MQSRPQKISAVHMLWPAYREAFERARSAVPMEIGGFIAGYVAYVKELREYHVIVEEQIPVESISTAVTVEFLSRGAEEVARVIKDITLRGSYLVGWYHSHPGYSCRPSRLDIKSHRTYFREPYHIGLIIDPLNKEACVFQTREEPYNLVPFFVWRRVR